MMKKYSSIVIMGISLFVLLMSIVLTVVVIKTEVIFRKDSTSKSSDKPNTVTPVIDSFASRMPNACGISYTLPSGWEWQGWGIDGSVINISSPDDIRQDEVNPRMTDAGPAFPSTSFYINCSSDVASVFVGQDKSLIENGSTVEAALAKGLLKKLKDAQYVSTTEVAGQKAFVYNIKGSSFYPDYDSVFVFIDNKWMQIRPSMTHFADMTPEQREILASIKILDTK